MSEAGPENDDVRRRLETETEVREPDAKTLAQQRETAQRRANLTQSVPTPGTDRSMTEAERVAGERARYAATDFGGLSTEDRAAQDARIAAQPGEFASRLDPEGRAAAPVSGPIDTGAEVHKFTGEAQDSPAAVSEGSSGEADHKGGSRISERLSGLDHDDR